MPNWKKVVVSGSAPTLSGLTSDGNVEITGSLTISGSDAIDLTVNGGLKIISSSTNTLIGLTIENEGTPASSEGYGAGIKLISGEGISPTITGSIFVKDDSGGGANPYHPALVLNSIGGGIYLNSEGSLQNGEMIRLDGGSSNRTRFTMFQSSANMSHYNMVVNNGGDTSTRILMGQPTTGYYMQAGPAGSTYSFTVGTHGGDSGTFTPLTALNTNGYQVLTNITASANISLPTNISSIDFINEAGIRARTDGSYKGLQLASGTNTSNQIWFGKSFTSTAAITASFQGYGKLSNVQEIEPHGNWPLILKGGPNSNASNDGVRIDTAGSTNGVFFNRFEIESDSDTVDAYFQNITGLGINKTSNFLAELDVSGDINASGDITASKFLGDNFVKSGGTSSEFLKADGSVDSTAYTTNTGTVTGVTGTAPIVSSGGTTPAISISAATNSAAGSMSAIDKGKIDAITVTSGVNLNTMNSSISTNTSNISGKAASGANSDITSITGLTTVLSVAQGGTGVDSLDSIQLSSFDDDLSYVDLVNAQTISGTKTFSVAQRFATGTVSAPSISFNSNSTYTTGFYLSNPHELSISRVGVQNFKFDSNGFQQLIAGGTSNFAGHLQAHCLGIGGTPSTTSGEIWAYGDVVANKSSDRRLKKYIKNIKNPLDKLSKINGVTFEWKKADEKMKKEVHSHEGPDVGVIAQEVEEVLPEIVATRDNGYKAVYYEKLVPLLIEAVKELKAEVDELKKSK